MTTDEREQLRGAVARMLADHASIDTVPETVESEPGYSTAFWRLLAEQGFLGLLVPAEHDGSGGTMSDLAVLAAEMGRVLLPGPFLTSAVHATFLAVAAADAGSAPARSLLPRLADGTTIACVVDDPGIVASGGLTSGLVLTGTASSVVGADAASVLLVATDVAGERAVVLLPVERALLTPVLLADATRRAAHVTVDGVAVPPDDVLLSGDAAASALAAAALRRSVAIAADAAGGAHAALAMATDYAKTRRQFDRPIGSFQAIKHKLASMYIAADAARAVTDAAACALDARSPDTGRTVGAAAAYSTAAFVSVAGDAIQTHGGIGFTWEHPCHRFLKRAWLDQTLLGGQRAMREAFAASLVSGSST